MSRLAMLTLTIAMLSSTVGCFQSRWAGYGGGCCAPQGGVYGAPVAPQGGGFYSPTGMSVPMNGPTAYGTPIYGMPYPTTTAMVPMDPLPTY